MMPVAVAMGIMMCIAMRAVANLVFAPVRGGSALFLTLYRGRLLFRIVR